MCDESSTYRSNAVAAAPHRFAWVGLVAYDDPEVEDQVARLRSAGAIALRVVPLPETPAMAAFERGDLLRTAVRSGGAICELAAVAKLAAHDRLLG
jgi:hypothetical protein